MQKATHVRKTKYCTAIQQHISVLGHATNSQILAVIRKQFPDVSATTVHRATSRLAARGLLGVAPPDQEGAMRYDANTTPHDHFLCNQCGLLRDAVLKAQVIPI